MVKAIFISVRTGSTRLPNKSILKIKNKHTIEYVIDSVKKSKYADKIVLCTTKNTEDVVLCSIAKANGIEYYCGDEHDKLKRWYSAAKKFDVEFFVTVDGDDLFYDSQLSDMCFEQAENGDVIDGQGLYNDTYGYKTTTIKTILDLAKNKVIEPHEVTTYIIDTELKVSELENVPDIFKKKNIRMTLDYQEDFNFFKVIIENINNNFTLNDVLSYIKDNKSVIDINYFRENDWKQNQL
mgnify:FL=1